MCDASNFDKNQLERNLKKQAFQTLKFKWEDDLLSTNELSLKLNAGRKHSGNFCLPFVEFNKNKKDELYTNLHTFSGDLANYFFSLNIQNIKNNKHHTH